MLRVRVQAPLLVLCLVSGCGKSTPVPTGTSCSDRSGVSHSSGVSWMDGCMSCSCGDLGDGSSSAICTHNSCPPDASTEQDASGDLGQGDGADGPDVGDAHPSVDSGQCQSVMAAYQAAYVSATECTVAAIGQCTVMITRPFACRCASFVNGSADAVTAAATHWTNSGCTDLFCTGACALPTHAVCVADPTSSTGGRCSNREDAVKPVGVPCTDDTECASGFCERPAGMCDAVSGACQDNSAGAACVLGPSECGCDGQTYASSCFRHRARVSKAHDGPC
jgi:hypothetical protein